ncbi:Aminopeptidase YwaD precursor [Pelotomaculum sp. FP]|uniref:M28 family peptidase n=1 Tax=Pelotomaculum sp. FP TaxID=261474 RepID=UPI001064C749|nr:M28 family peptidase [Pelotomaculum sp. FP]TEB11214.1 Aminopeptidase YwaD precursor [Pelotomaculum sp. FP]
MANFNQKGYVEHCINRLSVEIGARPAGSLAHLAAADFIAGEMKMAGFDVVLQKYPCPDWRDFYSELTVGGKRVPAAVNTFSPSCDVEAKLVPVSSIEDLSRLDVTNNIAVVYGDIASSSFLPKNFDRRYYVVESQDRFMELLENMKPGAIITVNHYDRPRPVLLEDSELSIPSVTVSRQDGLFVVQNAGLKGRLKIVSARRESYGSNVIGRRPGNSGKKIVICAHYDTNPATPGAMDNAAGISALLLIGRYLKQVEAKHNIEFVAYGGEDSWFPGDALYTKEYPPQNIAAAINIDGIGFKETQTSITFFGCPEKLQDNIMNTAKRYGDFVSGQFYESDHGFFWPLGITTLAFTSNEVMGLLGKITHTENDTPDILDNRKIEQTATLIRDVILMLEQKR